MTRTLLLLLPLALGCAETPPPLPGPEPLALQTYAVPDGYADRLVGTLNRAFARSGEDIARATAGPGGTVVVAAPRSVLQGVEALVDQVGKLPPEVPRDVQLDYWVVQGVPAAATRVPPDLAALAPVLEAVAEADGPLDFGLVAARRLRSLAGDRAELSDGVVRKLTQVAALEPGGATVVADLEVVVGDTQLTTRIATPPGQTTVIAQAGAADAAAGWLYVLVRPTTP
ncbi:MAG: hypothetical protein R3F59_14165 [Myxococcota bacterium]